MLSKHGVRCQKPEKGPPMAGAFEHIRLASVEGLAEEPLSTSLDDRLKVGHPAETDVAENNSISNFKAGNNSKNQQNNIHKSLLAETELCDAEKNFGIMTVTESSPMEVSVYISCSERVTLSSIK